MKHIHLRGNEFMPKEDWMLDKKALIRSITFLLSAFVWGYVDYINGVDATIGMFNVPQALTTGFLILGLVELGNTRKQIQASGIYNVRHA